MRPLLAAPARSRRGRRPVRPLRGGGEWLKSRSQRPRAAAGRAAAEAQPHRSRFVIAFLIFVFDQAAKWVVTYPLQLQQPPRRSRSSPSSTCAGSRITASRWACSPPAARSGRWLLVALTAAIATFVAVWLWREKRRDDSIALALVLGGALGNIVDRVRLRLCRRLRRPAFRRVAALFGLQCRRRCDYHRRAAFACPRAPDARWQGAEEGSLTMRIAPFVLAASAAAPARRLRQRRPVRPRRGPTSSRSRATRLWWSRPISR